MEKRNYKLFNTTGPCNLVKHYMLPAEDRCKNIYELINNEQYFVIHAARQSGKTTLLFDVMMELNKSEEYYVLYCSLESVQGITDSEKGVPAIISSISDTIRYNPWLKKFPFPKNIGASNYNTALKVALTDFSAELDKPLVILFDEADCLSNGTLICFLRQLREGYINKLMTPFPCSIALVGMRDIRDYKGEIRENRESLGSASPFNIVKKSLTIRDFTKKEVAELYSQHTKLTGQIFSDEIVDEVFYYTSGQPFLVNAIASYIIEDIIKYDFSKKIKVEYVRHAIDYLIKTRVTHIDSLLERLKEERVRKIIEPIILGAEKEIEYLDDDCQYVIDLGLIKNINGILKPSNRIYNEVIIRTLNYSTQYSLSPDYENRWIFGNVIDMNSLLTEFQSFWRENSDIWSEKFLYKEAAPHLILLGFLQRVLNGGGKVYREYASGRGRIDICIELGKNRYVIELKIYRNEKRTFEDGYLQISDYMDTMGTKEGWLCVFDQRPELSWDDKIYCKEKKFENKIIHIVGL